MIQHFINIKTSHIPIMLEDKLPELIRSNFNLKVLVVGSYKAK